MTYLFGPKYVVFYRLVYVSGFFLASFTDTTIIWSSFICGHRAVWQCPTLSVSLYSARR
ncbi:MAG: hypothetical protein U5L72_15820 [Bacteroidales bacterium]|nr:hypothetical protein [Bacteroidales bacterium]